MSDKDQNPDAEPDELAEHLRQVKQVFDRFDPSGAKGLNYEQFKTVLTDILQIDFDNEDATTLEDICSNLDPSGTGFVQYEDLYNQWTG